MSHDLFEKLLLSDGPMTPAEADRLRRHLAACPACAARYAGWTAVESAFRAAATIEPAPGFVSRVVARGAAEAIGRGRQQAWRLFGWTSVAATALAALLGFLLVQSPAQIPMAFAGLLQQVLRLWIWLRVVSEVVEAFVSNLPAPLTAGALVGFAFLFAGVGIVAALGTFGLIRFSFQGARR